MSQVTFSAGAATVEISAPLFPYQTVIDMPIDVTKIDNNTFALYDHGETAATYDKRYCECTFELSATDMASFMDLVRLTANGRAQEITMLLESNSGFHPFAPDKGDAGTFTVAIEILEVSGVQDEPWQYHQVKVRITNIGSFPSYSIPTEVKDGTNAFQIGTVQYLRFPPAFFDPEYFYGVDTQITEGSDAKFVDKSIGAINYTTKFNLSANETKAAKVLAFLVGATGRALPFTVVTDTGFYLLGLDGGSVNSYSVKLINPVLQITHERYDRFNFNLELCLVSIL
jgi:hypothetical protein